MGRSAADASKRCPARSTGRNAETVRAMTARYQVDRRPNNFSDEPAGRANEPRSSSEVAQDLAAPVERAAAVERPAGRARKRGAREVSHPLAVRADADRVGRDHG